MAKPEGRNWAGSSVFRLRAFGLPSSLVGHSSLVIPEGSDRLLLLPDGETQVGRRAAAGQVGDGPDVPQGAVEPDDVGGRAGGDVRERRPGDVRPEHAVGGVFE